MKYDAFISYRHLEKDMYVAKKVHKALETTKIPRKIQKETGKKRIQRVFRDQEELPIGSDLGNNIEYALSESGFLIVICSPETQKSYWVMKEIDTFIATHGRENVLAVLVEGEPGDSFPPQLLTDENGNPVEPLAADVRGATKKEMDKKIKVETMRLAASILHCDYDDLRQRHRERIVRRNMTIASGVAALGVAFGIYNAYNLARINENYQQKLINESKVIASTSLNVLEAGDRKTAALLALEGLPKEGDDRPLVIDGVYALSRALGSYELASDLKHDMKLSHHLPVKEFIYSSDGKYVLSYDNGDEIYFWDLATAGLLFEKRGEYVDGEKDEIKAIGVLEENPIVLSSFYLSRYDKEGNVIYQEHLKDEAEGGYISKTGNAIAVCYRDEIETFDLNTGKSTGSFKNPNEKSFSGRNMVYSVDLERIAVDYIDGEDDLVGLLLINTKTGEMVTLKPYGSSVLEVIFTADDALAVSTMKEDDLLSFEKSPMHVAKYDLEGEQIFDKEYEYDPSALNMSYSQLRSRIYNDGTEHAELFMSACKILYTLDLYTGEEIARYIPDSDLEAINISTNSQFVYVGTVNGNMSIINGSTGEAYQDYTTKVAESLIRMQSGFSRILVKSYRSSELTVMSYLSDTTAEEFATLDFKNHADQAMSPNETSFAISYSNYPEGKVVVFDAASGEMIGGLDIERITYSGMKYLDDDTLEVSDSAGNIYLYTISTKETEVISTAADSILGNLATSRDGRYFVYSASAEYMVVDVFEKGEAYSGKTNEDYDRNLSINDKAILSDASKIFFTNYSNQTFVMEREGEPKEILPDYRVLQIKLSFDDKYLLAACADGKLRLVDTSTLEVAKEVDYYGSTSTFMEISRDSTKLFLQGADLYLKIYDLEQDEFLFASDDSIEDIYTVEENPESHIVAFRTGAAMYFVDTKDYGFIAKADGGLFYMSKQNSIISLLRENVYKFKFKSLDDLKEEVRTQFGDATLTEEQRRKYKLN